MKTHVWCVAFQDCMILAIIASFVFDVFIQGKGQFVLLVRKENDIERDIKLNLWPFGLAFMTCRIIADLAVILKDINFMFLYFAVSPYWYLFFKNGQLLAFASR